MFLTPERTIQLNDSNYYNRFYWNKDSITSFSSLFQMQPMQHTILKRSIKSIQNLSIQTYPQNLIVNGIGGHVHLFGIRI